MVRRKEMTWRRSPGDSELQIQFDDGPIGLSFGIVSQQISLESHQSGSKGDALAGAGTPPPSESILLASFTLRRRRLLDVFISPAGEDCVVVAV